MYANRSRVLGLAKFIERLPEHEFAMDRCLQRTKPSRDKYDCGSPSCIAGWAAWLEQGRPQVITDNRESWILGRNNLVNSALTYLGITDPTEQRRVMNELFRGNYGGSANRRFTRAHAVHALRTYAATGEIVWPEVENDDA